MSIINLRKFKVTPAIAAHALTYLMANPATITIEVVGNITKYEGWGGRTVVKVGSEWGLQSFRRFEYNLLEEKRGESIDVSSTISKVHNRKVK